MSDEKETESQKYARAAVTALQGFENGMDGAAALTFGLPAIALALLSLREVIVEESERTREEMRTLALRIESRGPG